ncbi:zinc finger, CCHC-type containing protein [Tanacetum coccineum]
MHSKWGYYLNVRAHQFYVDVFEYSFSEDNNDNALGRIVLPAKPSRGDGIASIKRRLRDLSGDGVWILATASQPSNWLERLPAGSITTWEDLTTRFLAQFFPPGRTAKLRNDILMFQEHHGEYLSKAWTRFKDLLQKVPHHGIDLWLQVQKFYDHVNPVTRRSIDQSAGGKLRD